MNDIMIQSFITIAVDIEAILPRYKTLQHDWTMAYKILKKCVNSQKILCDTFDPSSENKR